MIKLTQQISSLTEDLHVSPGLWKNWIYKRNASTWMDISIDRTA